MRDYLDVVWRRRFLVLFAAGYLWVGFWQFGNALGVFGRSTAEGRVGPAIS